MGTIRTPGDSTVVVPSATVELTYDPHAWGLNDFLIAYGRCVVARSARLGTQPRNLEKPEIWAGATT